MRPRILVSTCTDLEQATAIADTLVEERLAACINILPHVRSVYRWKGKVEHSAECLLIVKTSKDKLAQTERRLQALHPYDTPELLVVKSSGVNTEYAKWFVESLCEDSDDEH